MKVYCNRFARLFFMYLVIAWLLVPDALSADQGSSLKDASDFDGDSLSDLALYNPSTGSFDIRSSRTLAIEQVALGDTGDIPVPGDYNGDGITDVATYSRSSGQWKFKLSNGNEISLIFGHPGEIPVPAKYAGNPCTDIATFDPRTTIWTIANCRIPFLNVVQFGAPGGVPVVRDYDGDGKDDLALFDRRQSKWMLLFSSTAQTDEFFFGLPGDIPAPADYDGDGQADAAVYRPAESRFYVRDKTNSASPLIFSLGLTGDQGIVLDVEGDQRADLVVFRPHRTTYLIATSSGVFFEIPFPVLSQVSSVGQLTLEASEADIAPRQTPLPLSSPQFLRGGVIGDFDRNGRSEAVLINTGGDYNRWSIVDLDGGRYSLGFGLKTDTLLSGDTDGDFRSEAVLVRNGPDNSLVWFARLPLGLARQIVFGSGGDFPLLGDIDCDGKDDLIAIRNINAFLFWFARLSTGEEVLPVIFGLTGDQPFVADTDGDGCDNLVVARKAEEVGAVYWFSQPLLGGDPEAVLWGLSASDDPLRPMDFDGNGQDDLVVVRAEENRKTAFIRLAEGVARVVPLGEGGIPLAGYFNGTSAAQLAVYRKGGRGSTSTLTLHDYSTQGSQLVTLPAFDEDKLMLPAGVTAATAGSGGGSSSSGGSGDDQNDDSGGQGEPDSLGCDKVTDFQDGAGRGALWKPKSDNTGKIVFLLPASYWQKVTTIDVFGKDGRKRARGRKRTCCPNGNRAHYDVPKYASELAPFRPLTVRLKLSNGSNECRKVPDPRKRWD